MTRCPLGIALAKALKDLWEEETDEAAFEETKGLLESHEAKCDACRKVREAETRPPSAQRRGGR